MSDKKTRITTAIDSIDFTLVMILLGIMCLCFVSCGQCHNIGRMANALEAREEAMP